jgi:hypothetical protein
MGMPGMAHLDTFNAAINQQVGEVWRLLGRQALIQLESPTLLGIAMNDAERDVGDPSTLERAARAIARVAADAPVGARFGIHLCLGDMNNRTHDDQPLTAGEPVSRASGALLAAWPSGAAPPEYIHFPVAGGRDPARLDPAIYAGLRGLRDVPETTRLIAGVAHESGMAEEDLEGRSLGEQRQALAMTEAAVDRRVDVAAPCGIARGRTVQDCRLVMLRMVQLARS